MFFKRFFKAFEAGYLVTHTFDITVAVFDMAQHVVSCVAGVIDGSTDIDVAAALEAMQDGLKAMEIPELLLSEMKRLTRPRAAASTPFSKKSAATALTGIVFAFVRSLFHTPFYASGFAPLFCLPISYCTSSFTRPRTSGVVRYATLPLRQAFPLLLLQQKSHFAKAGQKKNAAILIKDCNAS